MPRLTPAEKQDIIRYLEADKPLPEKYRFLLFEDKREVELVWNGKTNEVCNVVLPFQVIEQVDEPRAEAVKEQPTLFNMDERGRQLGGWTNKLIWGDNKLILSSLKNGPLREEYERQHFIGVNADLREEEQRKQLEEKESAFVDLILKAYKAEKTDGLRVFHGKKRGVSSWSAR
jgi:hypothetical protein